MLVISWSYAVHLHLDKQANKTGLYVNVELRCGVKYHFQGEPGTVVSLTCRLNENLLPVLINKSDY